MLSRFLSVSVPIVLFCIGTNVYAPGSQINLKGGLAGVRFVRAEANIEVFGMSVSEGESGLSIVAGVGVKFPVAENVIVFVEGRYQHAFIYENYKIARKEY